MSETALLGLFPLNTVLLPGEILALHIFEERYKLLFGEILEDGFFGLVFIEPQGLHEIGCCARVATVVDRLADGRFNLIVQGVRRFRLLEIQEPEDLEAQYIAALVEYVDDEDSRPPQALVDEVTAGFAEMLSLTGNEAREVSGGAEDLSFRVASKIDFGVEFKQGLLEELREERRLELVLGMMKSMLPRLRMRKEREAAIRGNGKAY
ncbi:MAG: LON peptidase substrate-binding domain-containing protein [Thermoleophilia bacterium]